VSLVRPSLNKEEGHATVLNSNRDSVLQSQFSSGRMAMPMASHPGSKHDWAKSDRLHDGIY
jgi:hypothetical protein